MSEKITPILMPKWGLSMAEGRLSVWHVEEGAEIAPGDDIMDVETDKIANVVEAADGGLLRRRIGKAGHVYPVRALLAVMAPPDVGDAELDAFIDGYVTPEADQEEQEAAPSYEYVTLPVGRIRYAARPGDGVPAVLIHGFGGDLDNWLFNIDALAAERPVYALDLPGHGHSVKAVTAPDLSVMVSALSAFLEETGIDRAHLVGHSMGGLIAGKLALGHPGRVASLALIASAGLGPEIDGDYISGFVGASSRKDLKPWLKHLFKDAGLVSRAMVDDLLKYKRLDGVSAFLEKLSASLFDGGTQANEIADELSRLQCPVTVIWGKDDAVIGPADANAVAGAAVHVLADAGHMVQMEKAGEVNALLNAHFNTVST